MISNKSVPYNIRPKQMTLKEFKDSLLADKPSPEISDYLKAMWYDGKNNWEVAHTIVQDIETLEAAHIHAYLHRKEGDLGNASYWYQRAHRNFPKSSLQEEWEEIVKLFLKN
jgi:hypothetical protein